MANFCSLCLFQLIDTGTHQSWVSLDKPKKVTQMSQEGSEPASSAQKTKRFSKLASNNTTESSREIRVKNQDSKGG